MDIKDVISLGVGALSACIATYAAMIARAAVNSQRRAEQWSMNHDLLARASVMLAADPQLLLLHGINPDELEQDGVSVEEFNYVHLHMDAGSAFYHVGGSRKVKLSEFRKNFLRNAKVQIIWKKHLSGKMFTDSPYESAVDAYIERIERSHGGA